MSVFSVTNSGLGSGLVLSCPPHYHHQRNYHCTPFPSVILWTILSGTDPHLIFGPMPRLLLYWMAPEFRPPCSQVAPGLSWESGEHSACLGRNSMLTPLNSNVALPCSNFWDLVFSDHWSWSHFVQAANCSWEWWILMCSEVLAEDSLPRPT